jgi:hypothetical protein
LDQHYKHPQLNHLKGGFVINGESEDDYSSFSISTTYDLPAFSLPFILLSSLPTIKSSKPSPLTSPALEIEWEYSSGKQGTDAIELSAIAAGKGGFIIRGESASFWSDHLASNAGDINGDGLDDLIISARETSDTSYVVFGKQDTDAVELLNHLSHRR